MIDSLYKNEPFEGKSFLFRSTVQQGHGNLVTLHWHEHLEFFKVLEGRVDVTLGSKTFRAAKGDIIYISSCQVHSVNAVDGNFCAIKGIVFDKYFVTNIIEGFETKHIYSLFIHSDNFDYIFPSSHPLWQELSLCIANCYEEFIKKEICFEMSIKSYIYRITSALLRYYKAEVCGHIDFVKASNELMRLKPVFDYIDNNYPNRINIGTLCRIINMSPDYFSKFFKKVTGKTPVEYITGVRINISMRLLVDTNLSITEISEKIGLCNINYFDMTFKKKTGITPMEYRSKLNSSE